ncbi:MAG TPA: hypothetical protein VHD87_12805 [Acidimicrobiales bacterium]|nr:hypothetical protein [Acidimicrobiales bacterium]
MSIIQNRSARRPINALAWLAIVLLGVLGQITATYALAGMRFGVAAIAAAIAVGCLLYGCGTRPAGV